MNIQDPVSDLITQIRNAYIAKKDEITIYGSKIKIAILKVLKQELFIEDYSIINEEKKIKIKILLKYFGKKQPIMKKITRISKPSKRVYYKKNQIQKSSNNFGITIISSSKGIITNKEANEKNCGGEILCTVE